MAAVSNAMIFDLAAFDHDFACDSMETKLRRANLRSKKLYRKRAQYELSKASKGECERTILRADGRRVRVRPAPLRGADLQGAVRAAARTRLARCSVESGADLPRVSGAERAARPALRGALPGRVAPMLRATGSPTASFQRTPMELIEELTSEELSLGWGPLPWQEAAEELAYAARQQAAKLEDERAARELEESRSTTAASDSEGAAAAELSTDWLAEDGGSSVDSDDQQRAPLEEVGLPEELSEDVGQPESSVQQLEHAFLEVEATATVEAARREVVLRQIVSHLQEQVAEANNAAAKALAQARQAEQNAGDASSKEAANAGLSPKAALKQAKQVERQQAAELRKRRNLAARQQAIQEKADRALQEADEIKRRAHDEADAALACALGRAGVEARAEAERQVSAELAKAQAEAQVLLKEGHEQAARALEQARQRAQAETEEARCAAEEAARAIRDEADAQARALQDAVALQAASARAQADAEARAVAEAQAQQIKERALADAQALRLRAAEQLQAEARQAAEKERAAEEQRAREERQAQQAREREERARALREAKALEQARARQVRKDAERERRRQQEAEALRAQASQEAEAIERALAEARAAAAQAAEERRRALATAAAARAAEERAHAATAAAEEEARAIRAEAEEEARAIKACRRRRRSRGAREGRRAAEAPTEPQDLGDDWEVVGETEEADEEGWDLA